MGTGVGLNPSVPQIFTLHNQIICTQPSITSTLLVLGPFYFLNTEFLCVALAVSVEFTL